MFALLAFFGAAVAAAPQVTPPTLSQTYEVRISNLDVVVADEHGTSVRGLRREDFEVYEDGVRQPITNFVEYERTVETASSASETRQEVGVAQTVSAPPPQRIVFAVDEMALHPLTREKLLREALTVVDSMGAADEASVIRLDAVDKIAMAFTSDRAALRSALQAALAQGGFRADTRLQRERIFFEQQVRTSGSSREYRDNAHQYAMRVNARIQATLTAVRALIATLATDPGKKTLVLISRSLTDQPGREAFTLEDQLGIPEYLGSNGSAGTGAATTSTPSGDGTMGVIYNGKELWYEAGPSIRRIGALAAAAGVTIYAVQPDLAGAIVPGGGADMKPAAARGAGASSPISAYSREILEGTGMTLGTFARLTGGKSFIGERDFGSAFRQISEDASAYYSIAYRPTSADSDTAHKVEVRLPKHPSYSVRTRTEVVRQPAVREMNDRVAATLLYPTETDDLHVKVDAARPVRDGKTYRVGVAVHIPISNLTFIPNGEKYRARFTAHYAAVDTTGNFASGTDREQILESDAQNLDAARAHDFTYTTTLVVARGRTRVAIGVQDPVSRLTSFKTLTVDAR